MAHTIQQCHIKCVQSFETLCTVYETSSQVQGDQMPLWKVLDAYGRYKSWAINIGAHHIGRESLDYRLREDTTSTRNLVMELQSSLCQILDDSAAILNGTRVPLDKVPTDSDSFEDEEVEPSLDDRILIPRKTELEKLLNCLESVVDDLYTLSVIVRQKPLSYDRYLKSSGTDISERENFDLRHFREKFPYVEPWLAVRIGNASFKRRQYLEYKKRKTGQMSQDYGTEGYVISETQTNRLPADAVDPWAQDRTLRTRDPYQLDLSTAESGPCHVAETMDFAEFNVATDDFDTASQSSHDSSVAGSRKIMIPLPPRAAQGGKSFSCPHCYELCRLPGPTETHRRRQWKVHVFEDIQSYMCTVRGCEQANTTMYDNRMDWWAHERQVHRKEWCYNMDGHEAFTEEKSFSEHMYEQHPDMTDTLKRPAIVARYERPLERATSACEFCASEETRALSATRFRKHLARHLEDLALCVLHGSHSEKNDDSTSDGDSDTDDKYFEKPWSHVNIDADKERSNAGSTNESQDDRCAAQQH